MVKDDLTNKLIKEIEIIQKLNGIKGPVISKNTKPIGDLAKFDSITAIEVLCSLEMIIECDLGIECELDVSLFFTDKGRKALKDKKLLHKSLTIDEIVNNILKRIKS